MSDITAPADRVIVIKRVFDAPRELVFRAWTEPKLLVRWFGPHGFTTPSAEMDVRVGGKWRIGIRSPEGRDYWMHGVYREVERPGLLVFTHLWEEGHTAAGQEALINLTFEAKDARTLLTFRKSGLVSDFERLSQEAGWGACLDRLAVYVCDTKADES